MATIKSYTDISQSKKLAEILPIESADMYYPWYIEEDGDTVKSGHRITTPNIGNFITHKVNKMILPCWSLAALFNILPNNEHITTTISRGGWKISPIEYINKYFCEYEDEEDYSYNHTTSADNPIDACYEMIIRLHELKML